MTFAPDTIVVLRGLVVLAGVIALIVWLGERWANKNVY